MSYEKLSRSLNRSKDAAAAELGISFVLSDNLLSRTFCHHSRGPMMMMMTAWSSISLFFGQLGLARSLLQAQLLVIYGAINYLLWTSCLALGSMDWPSPPPHAHCCSLMTISSISDDLRRNEPKYCSFDWFKAKSSRRPEFLLQREMAPFWIE